MKRCSRCKETKPFDQFSPQKTKYDGLQAYCKPCRCAYEKARREANIEKERAQDRAYNRAHRQQRREKARLYAQRPDIKERIRIRNAEYYANNTEARKQYNQDYRRRTIKVRRKKDAEYYQNNLAKRRQEAKDYRTKHPEIGKQHQRQRRAQKMQAPRNDLTHQQWLEIQAAQHYRCAYCGKRCKGRLTQDHILPLSKGGAHTLANIIGACHACNSKKQTGPPPNAVQPLLLTIADSKPYIPREVK